MLCITETKKCIGRKAIYKSSHCCIDSPISVSYNTAVSALPDISMMPEGGASTPAAKTTDEILQKRMDDKLTTSEVYHI